ncbi:MAG TPA: type II toxin-antitoxin system PemK/MazF family toxin [Candidatus Limnocylindrales bacterium]|nr:type II toxin-antitoxin system PemK/MazF family toxin [Candidatus Limnocylindrales bacterium]
MVGIGREPSSGDRLGPRRGDIHFIAFPDLGGHVLRGPHPAVVVQTDRMRRSSTVVVVPMTSAARSAPEEPPYLVAVGRRESGLDRDGFVKCDQPATLPTVVLGPRAGRLAPAVLDRVDAALRFVLEL